MAKTITPKQNLYQKILMRIVDYRCLGSIEMIYDEDKEWLKELACQADLLHGIPAAIVDSAVTDNDVIFLNCHAKHYLSLAQTIWVNNITIKRLIHQLYALVASQRPMELTWAGPELDDVDRQVLGVTAQ